MTPASSATIKDYLLGRLNAEQETELEELYFSDPQSVAEVWAVFAELSEQYLCDELTRAERSQFDRRLQRSPTLRQMFENEKALFDYAPTATANAGQDEISAVKTALRTRRFDWLRIRHSRPLRFALLSVSLLLAVGLWFIWQLNQAAIPASDQPVAVQNHRDAETPTPAPSLPASPSPTNAKPAVVATFFLPIQSLRAATDAPVISIPQQAQSVRLELQLMGGDSPSYSAALLSETSRTIREWKTLSPQHGNATNSIVLRLPAALLTESSYVVKLKPIDGLGGEAFSQQFRFTIAKR